MSNVKISAGNAKLGSIPSVSLPAGVTCRKDCECFKKCYAQRLERMRPSVRNAYQPYIVTKVTGYILERGRGVNYDVSILSFSCVW